MVIEVVTYPQLTHLDPSFRVLIQNAKDEILEVRIIGRNIRTVPTKH